MKRGILLIILFLIIGFVHSQSITNESKNAIQTFQTLPKLSIRALNAVSDNEVWFAANRGVWGYTKDGGINWKIDSIEVDGIVPEFRGMEVLNDSTVLLMGIASPGFIFKTTNKGKTWKIVYRNNHPSIFFDCLKFKDDKNGIAISDPIEDTILFIQTKDGGETWSEWRLQSFKFYSDILIYASSNTNIEWMDDYLWFITGGSNSLIYFTKNNGDSFEKYNTLLPSDLEMAGNYSLDFYNKKMGVVGGGIYDRAEIYIPILALTNDGGITWKKISISPPMFGSCVQFRNKNEIFVTGKPGTFSYNLKKEKVTFLKDENGNDIGFHTLRISPSKKVVWLAGGDGKIGKLLLND
jgi:photosystem II stability/assembly factor-like uncharacterized protein